jgi:hypothetical protein
MDSVTDKWMAKVRASKRGSANGKRHPHQPAVLIWLVETAHIDSSRMVNWTNSKSQLTRAIKSKGGQGSPESPITALTNAGILEMTGGHPSSTASAPAARLALNQVNPNFGLPIDVWNEITGNSEMKNRLLKQLETQLDK